MQCFAFLNFHTDFTYRSAVPRLRLVCEECGLAHSVQPVEEAPGLMAQDSVDDLKRGLQRGIVRHRGVVVCANDPALQVRTKARSRT